MSNPHLTVQLENENVTVKDLSELEIAIRKGNLEHVRIVLSELSIGDYILYRDTLLYIDEPTQEERDLLEESRLRGVEIGLFTSGERTEKLYGESNSMDGLQVLAIINRMSIDTESKSFVHAHWNDQAIPLPSLEDISMSDYIHSKGFENRVISWIPDKVFVIVNRH